MTNSQLMAGDNVHLTYSMNAVGHIAAAGTESNPDDKAKGIVKRATATLKGMTEILTDASKLADACTKLRLLLLSLFALL